ncbi:MAG: hypothetical protein JWM32_1393 [Verrucomicrobia bacterium]|nr:hypothetical protein [Verrucomicrobiota bacterium]
MVFFVAAFALLLHVVVWGAGAAILLTPKAWRNYWPIFSAPMGLALQSAIVWAGAYSGLAGANVYARWTELLPIVLLAFALRKHGSEYVVATLTRYWALGVLLLVDMCFLVLPQAMASRRLTTMSLGSCDAADYAAGARVLQEFAKSDRSGFIGLTEVVQVASVDNFFDFWLRLNHFTPSALIAFNGAVFGFVPHEITGLLTIVLLVCSLPAVFWMSRAVMRYSPRVSFWIAAIYGLNPITWYAVAHVAMGQLLAAHAIVFITWAGVVLWRNRLTWSLGAAMFGVLAMAYWLILGSYNFIVIICLVPALTYVGASVLLVGRWRRFGQWLVVMLVPLVVCGLLFTQRALGLIERFELFGQYDFGWHIPVMSPEGWLGAVNGPALGPVALWLRLLLSCLLFFLLVMAFTRDVNYRRRAVFRAVTMMLPVLVGYSYLELRGALLGTNASYDAYKLMAVFFPGQLCGYCYWTTLSRSRQSAQRWAARIGIAGMTLFNLSVAYRFSEKLENPPLIVDVDMVKIQKIEAMPEVTSINISVNDFWTRLWANAFLLKKPQYFRTHTYEGRLNTALKGDWELTDGVVTISAPAEAGSLRIGRSFSLLNTHSPYFLRLKLDEGWYQLERIPRVFQRWRWSKGDATLLVENPQAGPREVTLRLLMRTLEKREIQVWRDKTLWGTVTVGETLGERTIPGILLPPGESTLELRSSILPTEGNARDARKLGFAVYAIELEVQPVPDGKP